jgi:hypothetical protein
MNTFLHPDFLQVFPKAPNLIKSRIYSPAIIFYCSIKEKRLSFFRLSKCVPS